MTRSDIVMATRRGQGRRRQARAIRRLPVSIRLPTLRPILGSLYAERELQRELTV